MGNFNLSLTLSDLRIIITAIIDILIIWFVLYYALRIVRNNARTSQIFKGIIFLIIIDGLAKVFQLKTLQFLMDMFINWGFLAFIIIFQPEIRSILERIGKSNVFSRITTLTGDEKEALVDNIVTAVMLLSKDQTGALISIEQSHSLEDYIQTGTRMNSDVTAELLTSIFVTTTPLHDGAVIIQGDKIACASAYFPPTNMDLPSRYGARHRAAIGISEVTDAVTIIVSEETGEVSITEKGQIFVVNRQQLRDYLMRTIVGEATEVKTVVQSPIAPNAEEDKPETVFDKLALKKQEPDEKVVEEKIEVEEVHSTTPTEVVEEEVEKENTGEVEETTGSIPAQELPVNQEAKQAEIKFPIKKDTQTPSYPKQKKKKEKKDNKRLTPEEVQALRDEQINKLRQAPEDDEKKFDTSAIDISKVVGFDGELDEQFEMVEQLPSSKKKKASKGKGGEE